MKNRTKIYLIRHGETEYNSARRFQGSMDIPLNEKGIAQSKALAEYLKDVCFDAVYASDLSRAIQTAQPLAMQHGLDIIIKPDLREISYGDWEGMLIADIAEKYPSEMALWRESTDKLQIPGGERFKAAAVRSMTALTETAQENIGKTIAIITHGGIVRALISEILGCSFHATWNIRQDNCAVNILNYAEDKFSIELLNYNKFL